VRVSFCARVALRLRAGDARDNMRMVVTDLRVLLSAAAFVLFQALRDALKG
jgi:hypothetical protein